MCKQTESVDAILMASGFSRRFGQENKLLVSFCGKPLISYPLSLCCNSGLFRQVFVVAQDDAVMNIAQTFSSIVLHNKNAHLGNIESVRLGVQASLASHYLFVPCDQPLLDLETLQKIVDSRREGCIVQPCYKERVGSPVLFSASFKNTLCNLLPNQSARSLLSQYPKAVLPVHLTHEDPLLDADTPQELLRLENLYRQSN